MTIISKMSNGLLAGAMVLVLCVSTANAQTPDGETPANEGICDQLVGGTPGLYGLCVAYCEAQDHTDAVPGDPPARKILDVYDKRRQVGDPEMPCLQAPCPCWSENDLDIALPTLTGCTITPGELQDQLSIFGPSPGFANNARYFRVKTSNTVDLCFFIVQQQGLPNTGVRRNLIITKEEGAACEASALQHAASLGVDCEAP